MALVASETGGKQIDPVPEGVHIAVCYALYDLGTQYNETFQKSAHKVLIAWELPDITMELERDGHAETMPRVISKQYTCSLHEKATLRAHLQSWRGRSFTADELAGFDLRSILGHACQMQIIHATRESDGRVFANISAILPLPKGATKPEPVNPKVQFDIEDAAVPEQVPEWIVKIIEASEEWQARAAANAEHDPGDAVEAPTDTVTDDDFDDVPF